MLGFMGKLFGSSKSVDTIIETGAKALYNGIDKAFYTEEEKEDARQKGQEVFLNFVKIAYDQNSIRSVARRWLAFMVVAPTMLMYITSGILYYWSAEYAGFMAALANELIPWAGGILMFYFGPHIVSKIGGNKDG